MHTPRKGARGSKQQLSRTSSIEGRENAELEAALGSLAQERAVERTSSFKTLTGPWWWLGLRSRGLAVVAWAAAVALLVVFLRGRAVPAPSASADGFLRDGEGVLLHASVIFRRADLSRPGRLL